MPKLFSLSYTIKRNGDGYYVVMLGKAIMCKRTNKRDCQSWVDLQEGRIDDILTGWRGCSN